MSQQHNGAPARAAGFGARAISWMLAGGLLIAAAAGCGDKGEQSAAPPPLRPQEPRVTGDEPTRDLPPEFNPDMPVYPGASVEAVKKPRGSMREIVFSTAAPLDEIVDFYKTQLKERGFHITSSLIMAARRTWSVDFHRKGTQARILLYPDDKDQARMTINLIYEMPRRIDPAFIEPVEDFDVVGPGEYVQQTSRETDQTGRN